MGISFNNYASGQAPGAALVAKLVANRQQAEGHLTALDALVADLGKILADDAAAAAPALDADDVARVKAILGAMKAGGPALASTADAPLDIPGLDEIAAAVSAVMGS